MLLWVFTGLLLLAAFPAHAARITTLDLRPGPEATFLVLQGDAPFKFQLDLAGPQDIEISLPSSSLRADLPTPGANSLVSSIRQSNSGGNLILRVRTSRPGVTILPMYDAATRRLSIELGGQPGEVVDLPQATPQTVRPTTGVSAAKVPVDQAAEAQVTATPQPPRQNELMPAQEKPVPNIKAIRVANKPSYTRVVVQGDAPVEAQYEQEGRIGWLRLERGGLISGAVFDETEKRIRSIGVIRRKPLLLRIEFDDPPQRHRLFYAIGGRAAVLDVDMGAQEMAAAEADSHRLTPRQEQEQPQASVARGAISWPDQGETAGPVAVATMPTPEREEAQATAETAPVAPKPTATPRPSQRFAERAAQLVNQTPVYSVVARVNNREPYVARGAIPSVHTPPVLAHPRTPSPAATAQATPQSPEQIIDIVRQARENARSLQEAAPPTPTLSPEEMAKQQETEQKNQLIANLMRRGNSALEGREYNQAYITFEEVFKRFPESPEAAEAAYRLADAFYYLHERDMPMVFNEVMYNYQRAIDIFPDSDQVPWALLMMGRASMLAEEPFRGMGYFEIVIQDYPKSEYVPLAMVDRGRSYERQGKFGLAIDQYKQVLDKYPDSRYRVDAQWGLAQGYFGQARYRAAADVLMAMAKENPQMYLSDPELLYYIGEAEFQLGNYEKARYYFLWALNIRPDMRDGDIIMTRVGDSYGYQGHHRAAREIYAQVLDVYPDTDGAIVSRIRLAESPEKDTEHPWDIFQVKADVDAYRTYKEISDKYTNREVGQMAKVKLAVYFYKKKRFAKAIDILEKLLQLHPNTSYGAEVDYTLNLAVIGYLEELKSQGKPLELMDAYLRNRVLLKRPNSNEMLLLLAWAYGKANLYDRAAGLYRVLAGRGVVDPNVWLAWAVNLYKNGEYGEAAETLSETDFPALSPEDQIIAKSLYGKALARTGEHEKSAKVLTNLLKKSPNHNGAAGDYRALGQSLVQLKRYKEALTAFERANSLLEQQSGEAAQLERFMVAMDSGAAARLLGDKKRSILQYATAEGLALSADDKAQARYELAKAYQRDKQTKPMVQVLKDLVEMQKKPWSDMAKGLLDGLDLSKRMVEIGK